MLTGYESDITRFIRDLKRANPEIERGQREGRAMFWDRSVDADTARRYRSSGVAQPAYVYGSSLVVAKAKR